MTITVPFHSFNTLNYPLALAPIINNLLNMTDSVRTSSEIDHLKFVIPAGYRLASRWQYILHVYMCILLLRYRLISSQGVTTFAIYISATIYKQYLNTLSDLKSEAVQIW